MYLSFDSKKFVASFKFAFSGVKTILKEEQNFRIMIFVALLVVVLMTVFNLSLIEKAILVLTIFLVFTMELFNSVIERVTTLIHKTDIDLKIKKIKDILAGTSLFVCLGAVIIAILILLNNLP